MSDFFFPQNEDFNDAENFSHAFSALNDMEGHVNGRQGEDVSTGYLDVSAQISAQGGVEIDANSGVMFVLGYSNIAQYSEGANFSAVFPNYVIGNYNHDANYDISADISSPEKMVVNDGGTKVHIIDGFNRGQIFQYTLSTAWDITTASFDGSLDISSETTGAYSVIWNDDGSKFYVTDKFDLWEYSTDTNYDVINGTTSLVNTFDPSPKIGQNIEWNSDGSKLYGKDGSSLTVFNASAAYDSSALSHDQSFPVFHTDIDGVKFFQGDRDYSIMVNGVDDRVHIAHNKTTGERETHTPVGGARFGKELSDPHVMKWGRSGTKLYVAGDSTKVFEYDAKDPYQTESTVLNKAHDFGSNISGSTIDGIEWSDNGERFYLSDDVSSQIFEFVVNETDNSWSITDLSQNATFSTTILNTNDGPGPIQLSDSEDKLYIAEELGEEVSQLELSTPAALHSATFPGAADLSPNISEASGVAWNNDGTKFYVADRTNDTIEEFSASEAYNPKTLSHNNSFDVSTELTGPAELGFNDTGSKMYVGGDDGSIYEYALSTSFDTSTASLNDSLDVSGQTSTVLGISFNGDGTKLFVTGQSIYEYSLSTAYDISTASFTDGTSLSGVFSSVGHAWNGDGTKLFVSDGDTVDEYNASTAYDASSITHVDGKRYGSNASGIAWNSDGTELCRGLENAFVQRVNFHTAYDASDSEVLNQKSFIGTQSGFQSFEFVDGGGAFVLLQGGNGVYKYTPSTSGEVDTIPDTHDQFSDPGIPFGSEDTTKDFVFGDEGYRFEVMHGDFDANTYAYSLGTEFDFSDTTAHDHYFIRDKTTGYFEDSSTLTGAQSSKDRSPHKFPFSLEKRGLMSYPNATDNTNVFVWADTSTRGAIGYRVKNSSLKSNEDRLTLFELSGASVISNSSLARIFPEYTGGGYGEYQFGEDVVINSNYDSLILSSRGTSIRAPDQGGQLQDIFTEIAAFGTATVTAGGSTTISTNESPSSFTYFTYDVMIGFDGAPNGDVKLSKKIIYDSSDDEVKIEITEEGGSNSADIFYLIKEAQN